MSPLSPRDTLVYSVFAALSTLTVLVLLAGAVVTAFRDGPAPKQSAKAAQRVTAAENREALSAAMRSYAVVSEKRTPRLDIHTFGLPGADSLNSAIEASVLSALEQSGAFAARAAFDPVQTAPVHRWPTTAFAPARTTPEAGRAYRSDPRTVDIRTRMLAAGGDFVITAVKTDSPRPQTRLLLTDLAHDRTIDARRLFAAPVDPATVGADDTGTLTIDDAPVSDADLSSIGHRVQTALHSGLELPQPGDQRSPDFSCALLPCVALTYDDGPGEAKTEQAILDAADEANIRLTYFFLGTNTEAVPEVAERIIAAGHEVDNHTFSHVRMDTTSSATNRKEIDRTGRSLRSVGVKEHPLVRPPYGALDRRAAHALGDPAIIWDVDTGDWQHRSAEKTVSRVQSQARPGSIVLMHSIHHTTAEAAPAVFSAMADEGLYAVTVRELFSGIELKKGGSYFCRGYADELCSNPEHPAVMKN
ncbi:polysaccharide deacetylase family protein [Brevibacterium limosum]|uniref:polysaccharide deacetylase family protein n=1 Tax=Brevibacterium limosum TaxID=2697565 RepID=UPI001420F74B|nr:polysaccharide deacetylase family protein [Brevibacterium limosum]